MPTDIMEYNEKGLVHGYWEMYFSNGKLYYKGYYINGEKHGPWEYYCGNGELWYKGTLDMGEKVGLWFFSCEKIFYAD